MRRNPSSFAISRRGVPTSARYWMKPWALAWGALGRPVRALRSAPEGENSGEGGPPRWEQWINFHMFFLQTTRAFLATPLRFLFWLGFPKPSGFGGPGRGWARGGCEWQPALPQGGLAGREGGRWGAHVWREEDCGASKPTPDPLHVQRTNFCSNAFGACFK